MAIDETIWNAVSENGAAPTLRFYAWQPFCLSIGRLQKQLPAAFARGDFDWVRRPTGGRAVWHAHEITYAVSVRLEDLPEGKRSVNGAYEWLSAGFITGLQTLGLAVELAPNSTRTSGSNCFAASAGCDFLARGKKLIGAAQCRNEVALLQHGSLLLAIDAPKWRETAGEGIENAISLSDLGAEKFSRSQIETALAQGLAAQTGGEFHDGELCDAEEKLAQTLETEKYRAARWNCDGK